MLHNFNIFTCASFSLKEDKKQFAMEEISSFDSAKKVIKNLFSIHTESERKVILLKDTLFRHYFFCINSQLSEPESRIERSTEFIDPPGDARSNLK